VASIDLYIERWPLRVGTLQVRAGEKKISIAAKRLVSARWAILPSTKKAPIGQKRTLPPESKVM
jgi:hypothetical protein